MTILEITISEKVEISFQKDFTIVISNITF